MKADYSLSLMKAMGIIAMVIGGLGLKETGWAIVLIILGFVVYSVYDWVQEYSIEDGIEKCVSSSGGEQ